MEFKIILYGDYSVGKTALSIRLLRDTFDAEGCVSTIGASFSTWRPEITRGDITQKVNFGIWDTAGQERFNTLLPLYLRDADAVIYCWEYNTPFDQAKAERMYKRAKDHSDDCLFYFVMTKVDKCRDKRYYNQEVETWVKDNGLQGCFYTSSQSGFGVKDLFTEIARTLVRTKPPKEKPEVINITKSSETNKCCY